MNPSVCHSARALARLSLSVLLCVLLAPALLAQGPGPGPDPDPVQRELPTLSGFSVVPFDFSPPGARSLGMGGTFIALADDATAAEANPAGLTQLSRPEVSIHGRHSEMEIETLDINAFTALDQLNRERTFPGRLMPASTVGNAFASDTRVRFEPEVDEVSFASYVKPYDTYTFSVFYQRGTDFAGAERFQAYDDSVMDFYQARQEIAVRLENFGVSAAFEAGDELSVGFTVRYSTINARAFQDLRIDYGADIERGALPAGSSLEQVQALGILDQRILREDYDDTQGDITFAVGLLWKPSRFFSMGLVYKQGGDFRVDGQALDFGCLDRTPAPGTTCEPGTGQLTNVNQRFEVPDFLGLGFALHLSDRFKIALDFDAIEYSELNPVLSPNDIEEVRRELEPIDDVVEVHFGIEYISFLGRRNVPFTLRAGVYTDPDHDGIKEIDSDDTIYTLGFGTVFMERFQVDVAASSSDRTKSGILSMVYRF